MSKSISGTALYRLYRSRKFDDVVGQKHITQTLKNAVKQNRLSHAYLFVGPRGVGKTSVARILAHAVNGLPYEGQTNHLDIVEIDAASNRGIDEIRDLRDKVHLAPTSAKYKVYIIDEVHMLTTPAFSALLKTLEEPPAHVIFILATTEGHKVPATIISRTQRFGFLPISPKDAQKHLSDIVKQEKLKVEPAALDLIAYYGFGSLRDSLGILDQLASQTGPITTQDVNNLIGLASQDVVDKLISAVNKGQTDVISLLIDDTRAQGISPALLARQLIDSLRAQRSELKAEDVNLFSDLLEVATANDPELKLEVVLLRRGLLQADSQTFVQKTATQAKKVAASSQKVQSAGGKIKANEPTTSKSSNPLTKGTWTEILSQVKDGHNSLYAVLRQAKATQQEQNLVLEFKFEFHRQRVNETKNRQVIEQAVQSVLGQTLVLKTLLNSQLGTPKSSSETGDNMTSVISLMGGGDVMELGDG